MSSNKSSYWTTVSYTHLDVYKRQGLSNAENCEILAKYFDQLLNCPEPIQKLELSDIYENLEEDTPPTIKEIEEVIKTLKNNKASGEDSISPKLCLLYTSRCV